MHFCFPTFWPYFYFGVYIFILPLLVPKWKKYSILVPTITHLTEISYVANRAQYYTINANVAIKIIKKIIWQLINAMSDPCQLRILKINLSILTK